MKLKVGQIFEHKAWLDPNMTGAPLQCKVTKIARGTLYYRPFYGRRVDGTEWLGSATHFPVEMTEKYVKEN